jgi:truncated hemoglobin YjbI
VRDEPTILLSLSAGLNAVMRIDQITDDGIRSLVDGFYAKVRVDPNLGPIFKRAIPGDWGPHLATMRDFWSSVMLVSGRYKGNPVAKHLRLEGMEPRLFDRWLELSRRRATNCSMTTSQPCFASRQHALPKVSSLLCSIGQTGLGRGAQCDLRRHR